MKSLFSVLVLAGSAAVLAQQPPAPRQESLKGVVLKKLAPVSTDMLRVKMPRPVDRKLKNGLSVMIIEDHRLPTVSLDLVLPASTLNDPEGLPGVAEGTAQLMREGTQTRNSRQIAESLAEMGASLSIFAENGARSTHLYASALLENLDPLLELVGDVLLHPAFPQEELDKSKARMLAQLQQARSSPYFLANERMRLVVYAGDARSIVAPTPEAIRKTTRQNLVDYYKTYYKPGGSILGVTGDVKPDTMVAKLEKYIGAWESGKASDPVLPLRPAIPEARVYLVHRPNSVQTNLLLVNRAIGRMDPDYIACMVMNRVLGEGPAARLFRNIREDKGYTYGVYSGFTALKFMNHFSASSSVRTEVTGPAMEEFLNEFRAIREKPVPAEELENAKRAIVAGFALSLESQNGVLRQRLLLREYGLPDDYWDTYPEKVMLVTAADVQRVAQKYVPLDNLQIIAVGDAGKIADVLRKYGPLEQYDAEGKKIN